MKVSCRHFPFTVVLCTGQSWTLLVLLMVARMGVMLYQDLAWGHVRIVVAAGK